MCLNMIVKNETKVIRRCLESVKPIIDYWVIVDTGSTDGTQGLVKEIMKDIPGELHERPWKNFAHNRMEALELARSKADYLLFVDADDKLEIEKGFKLANLNLDAYFLWIHYGGSTYSRIQVIKTALPWRWEGVVHEYLAIDQPYTADFIKGVTYVVVGGGGRSEDPKKFLKDAEILEKAFKEDPNNARTAFYLAQSYRDAGEKKKAIEWYKKRIEMRGWDEEVFWAMVQLATLRKEVGEPLDDVLEAYWKAHLFRSHRSEPIYHMTGIFMEMKRYDLAYECLMGFQFLPKKSKDLLFNEDWIEQYGLVHRLSLVTYHLGKYKESIEAAKLLLSAKDLPDYWKEMAEGDLFYAEVKQEAALRGEALCLNLKDTEKNIHSHHGEDGVISFLLDHFKCKKNQYVSFGNDSHHLTEHLKETFHASGVIIDGEKETLDASTVGSLLEKYEVQNDLDLLLIDEGYNDFYLFKSLPEKYSPALVIIGFNAHLGPTEDKVVQYIRGYRPDNTSYFGASIQAMYRLGKKKGYSLVYVDSESELLFFVQDKLLEKRATKILDMNNPEKLYRPIEESRKKKDPFDRSFVNSAF